MSIFDEPRTNKQRTFNLMAQLDIRKAEVEFSGGNDEGGVDNITVYRGERQIEGNLPVSYATKDATSEQELAELLGRPVYDKYYGFAGEFYVQGTVVWDLATKKVNMGGSEETMYGNPFGEEL